MKHFLWLLCCSCLLLVACAGTTPNSQTSGGTSSTTTTAANGLTILQVTRTDLAQTNNLGPLARTITRTSTIQQLYLASLALPAYASGVGISDACINNLGVVYHLAFFWGSTKSQVMDLEPGSCQVLSLSQTDTRRVNATYLHLVAQAIQVRSLTSN
jgi:hypothetical protein